MKQQAQTQTHQANRTQVNTYHQTQNKAKTKTAAQTKLNQTTNKHIPSNSVIENH